MPTLPKKYPTEPSPNEPATIAPLASLIDTANSSLLVENEPNPAPILVLVVAAITDESSLTIFIQRSPPAMSTDKSVSAPPLLALFSMSVMMVPDGMQDSWLDCPNVIVPEVPPTTTCSHANVQPRRSRQSITTTNSIQLPPLPSTRPKCVSADAPPSASTSKVPPFKYPADVTALYSFKNIGVQEAQSASAGARSVAKS